MRKHLTQHNNKKMKSQKLASKGRARPAGSKVETMMPRLNRCTSLKNQLGTSSSRKLSQSIIRSADSSMAMIKIPENT
jgi:hypothetical protein